MPSLSPQDLNNRYQLDYRILRKMTGDNPFVQVESYRNEGHANARTNAILTDDDARQARVFLIQIRMKSLVAKDKYGGEFAFRVTPGAGGNYPYSTPHVVALKTSTHSPPWHHRVHPHAQTVCVGDKFWATLAPQGNMGHVVVHLCRLLNFDEPTTTEKGYHHDVWKYWQDHLDGGPITPNFKYPHIPTADEVHPQGMFRPKSLSPATTRPAFRPVSG